MSLLALIPLAAAGYGDVVDGMPSWEQRSMHTWTNFVRVDPTGWADEYSCSLNEFKSSEKQAKDPFLHHDGLAEIAQLHSEDMNAWGQLSHSSSDGTSFNVRVPPYYAGNTWGENVAWGYSNEYAAVFQGWMCSSGHRENIMSGNFEHMGTGVAGTYYTQDFGGGYNDQDRQVAMGMHYPKKPNSGEVEYFATWKASQAPAVFYAHSDKGCTDMELIAGESTRGAFVAEQAAGNDCVRYRFVYETPGGAERALPETGSYQYGQGCEEWVNVIPDSCEPDGGRDGGGDGGGDGGSGDGGSGDGGGDGGADDSGVDTGDTGYVSGDNGARPPRPGSEEVACGGCASPAAPAGLLWLLGLAAIGRRRRG